MNNLTPAQMKVIETWTEQRDSLLRDIGIHTTELNEKKKLNIEAGLALADIHTQLSECRGRLAELSALEDRWRSSLSTDISELEVRKSRLEAEIVTKELELKSTNEKYVIITASIDTLSNAHDKMSDQAAIVNKVVGELIETAEKHFSGMRTTFAEVNTIATEVIDKANKNIETSNIVIPKMTQFIIDLQRPIPVRRVPERQVFRHMNKE